MKDEKHFSSWEEAVSWLKQQPDQQDLVISSYYDDPLSEAAERYYQGEEWKEVMSLLPSNGGDALDVGAGRGIASYALAKSGFNVTALEPDLSDLVGAGAIKKLAHDAQLPISVKTEYSEQLPFADCVFDVVFARAVLHHMKDLKAGCREICRVLKPGGVFIAVREHVISREKDLAEFLNIHPLHHMYGGEHAYLLKEYRAAIEASGLSLRKQLSPLSSPINYYPQTKDSLKQEIALRLPKVLSSVASLLLRSDILFFWVIALFSLIDNRPGRLYSFVSYKGLE